MSEEPKDKPEDAEDPKSGREKVEDGIKQGLGVLSAFKEALEETIQEARERGDLSTDRAKEVMKDALDRAQSAADGARERIERTNPAEVQAIKDTVESIRSRVSDLEESVFGESKGEPRTGPNDEEDPKDGAESDAQS